MMLFKRFFKNNSFAKNTEHHPNSGPPTSGETPNSGNSYHSTTRTRNDLFQSEN